MVKIIQRTLLLFFITSFLFFFSPIHAMDKIETVGGVLQVKEKELEGRTLYLRGKKIPKIENELIDILEKLPLVFNSFLKAIILFFYFHLIRNKNLFFKSNIQA